MARGCPLLPRTDEYTRLSHVHARADPQPSGNEDVSGPVGSSISANRTLGQGPTESLLVRWGPAHIHVGSMTICLSFFQMSNAWWLFG